MKLQATLKLMCAGHNEDMNIKLIEYLAPGRVLYDGKLGDLLSYLRSHTSLDKSAGFPVQVNCVYASEVVEILVDKDIKFGKIIRMI